jgi:hypothetical protein
MLRDMITDERREALISLAKWVREESLPPTAAAMPYTTNLVQISDELDVLPAIRQAFLDGLAFSSIAMTPESSESATRPF